MEIDQVRAFLTLAEELHFGRTAARLYRSQSRVSRLISSLEEEIGGLLFERTSRHVRLTPLGAQLRDGLGPAHTQLTAAYAAARRAARDPSGVLRVGHTSMTEGPTLTHLLAAHRARYPESEITTVEVPIGDPYSALRAGTADVLFNWLAVEEDEDDLTVGPAIEYQPRVLAVASTDLLARGDAVTLEDLVGRRFPGLAGGVPAAIENAFYPLYTHSGRPIPRDLVAAQTIGEVLALVAQGRVVHATVSSMATRLARDDIVLLPFSDLPPLALGLIWQTAAENGRIRALAETARAIGQNMP